MGEERGRWGRGGSHCFLKLPFQNFFSKGNFELFQIKLLVSFNYLYWYVSDKSLFPFSGKF
jgi:hypothetical protein